MEGKVPVSNPWICVDFDGTIMEDGYYPGFGPSKPGAREKLQKYSKLGIKIMIFTARTSILGLDGTYQNVNNQIRDIEDWCAFNKIPCDYVYPLPKPTCVLAFIDDRAIRMEGEHGWEVVDAFMEKDYIPKLSNWKEAILHPKVEK